MKKFCTFTPLITIQMKKINLSIIVLFISFCGFSQDIITATSGFEKANNSDFGVPVQMFAGNSKFLYVLTDDINSLRTVKKKDSEKRMHLQAISKTTMKTEKSVKLFGLDKRRDKLLKDYEVHQVFSIGEYVHIVWRNKEDLEFSIYVESFSLDLKTRALPKMIYNNSRAKKQQKTDYAKILDFKFFTEEGLDKVVGAMEVSRGEKPMVVQFFVLNSEMDIESVESNIIPITPRFSYGVSRLLGKYFFSKKGVLYCSFEVTIANENDMYTYTSYRKESNNFFLVSRFDGKENQFDYFIHRNEERSYTLDFFEDGNGTRCIGRFRDHSLKDGTINASHGIYLADFEEGEENLVITKQYEFSSGEYEKLFGEKRKKSAIDKDGGYVDYKNGNVSFNFSEIQVDPKTNEISWLSTARKRGSSVTNNMSKTTKYADYSVNFIYCNFNEEDDAFDFNPFSHSYGKVKADHAIEGKMISLIKDGKRMIFFDAPDLRENAAGKKSYFTDYVVLDSDGNGEFQFEEYMSDQDYLRPKLDVRNMFVQNNTLYTFGVNRKKIMWAKFILYPSLAFVYPVGLASIFVNQRTITNKYYYGYSKIEGDDIDD
jgi:hypothetical protein